MPLRKGRLSSPDVTCRPPPPLFCNGGGGIWFVGPLFNDPAALPPGPFSWVDPGRTIRFLPILSVSQDPFILVGNVSADPDGARIAIGQIVLQKRIFMFDECPRIRIPEHRTRIQFLPEALDDARGKVSFAGDDSDAFALLYSVHLGRE